MVIRNKCYNTCFYLHGRFRIRKFFLVRNPCRLISIWKFECMTSSFCPTFYLQVAISRALASFWRYPYLDRLWYEISVTIPVSTFTVDFVFENSFLSAMTPYVDSRDGRSLSIYGSQCQIWKTFPTILLTDS
jgi:hypothetical protein